LNPFHPDVIVDSVKKTRRLLVVDSGTRTAGFAGEVIAATLERLDPACLVAPPARVTLPDAPAPTSRVLERAYYPTPDDVAREARRLVGR
jgi:pyruvate dehydrogenase E1 component beta subunit